MGKAAVFWNTFIRSKNITKSLYFLVIVQLNSPCRNVIVYLLKRKQKDSIGNLRRIFKEEKNKQSKISWFRKKEALNMLSEIRYDRLSFSPVETTCYSSDQSNFVPLNLTVFDSFDQDKTKYSISIDQLKLTRMD